jgi:hypothetical protein
MADAGSRDDAIREARIVSIFHLKARSEHQS